MIDLSKKIYVLDGAFGTQLQKLGVKSETGCNDFLAISHPEIVAQITRSYLDAGADIVTTNTFNSNAVSLSEYSLSDRVRELNIASASIARREADHYGAYVAGSVGPTSKSLSISPDMENPAVRSITFDALRESYRQQISALVEGGVDLILLETAFDTLNVKAAVMAMRHDLGLRDFPLVISGTITDSSGRTLSGQNVEAFYYSVTHANPLAIGLNCSFGAEKMKPYIKRLSDIADCGVSAHPNAGLPDICGNYTEPVEHMLSVVEGYLQEGIVNIIGGCCGTTPQYIAGLKQLVGKYSPRHLAKHSHGLVLTGLDPLKVDRSQNFINVGERSNVAGSKKFARLIADNQYEQAVDVAVEQVDAGAQIVDVCMDAPMIDSTAAMTEYLLRLQSEPAVSIRPTMIDSSSFETIEAALKTQQGKPIVNSISLKEGEEEFLRRARLIRDYGAAMVVMLFDENGQADTYERKIEVAQRAYNILVNGGIPSEDIVLDPNILAIATGIPAHDRYALDFIRATEWIKKNLPGVSVSGGISNLSFAFRGNDELRSAMHSVFLYHAMAVGMDMAILNPSMIRIYDELDPLLRERIEDLIFMRREDAAQHLTELVCVAVDSTQQSTPSDQLSPAERLFSNIVKGRSDSLETDLLLEYKRLGNAMAVVDSSLMPAMSAVGEKFSSGMMFLPQVIKSARAMKAAVDLLEPYISSGESTARSSRKALIATVSGDVHDIGKNIVALVLRCNGYDVIDLGVMVPAETILETAKSEKPDCVLLSGLITPSLEQMAAVIRLFQGAGLRIPIEIGGATTSAQHTAMRLAPLYDGPVLYSSDASGCVRVLSDYFNDPDFSRRYKEYQKRLCEEYQSKRSAETIVPLSKARELAGK